MSGPLGAGLRLLPPLLLKNGSASPRRFFLYFPIFSSRLSLDGLVILEGMHLFIGKEVILSQHDRGIRELLAPKLTNLLESEKMRHHCIIENMRNSGNWT